jgi:hypothetical protein
MGVGHIAVALGAAKAVPRLNVGWLVFSALLADFLLGIFALAGLEHATVPPDYAARHYLLFIFPYSHGLLSLVLWAAIAGFLISWQRNVDRMQVFLVIAAVVLSHFVLDAAVHVAGLPLTGENSPKIGLGLWEHLPLELSIETLMTAVGIGIYLRVAGAGAPGLSRYGIPIFAAVVVVLTWTQLFAVVPPKPDQLTVGWIVAPLVFSAIAYGLDIRRIRRGPPAETIPA